MYGMNERQFRTLFIKASKIKEGKHGVNFMILLEQRLDNVVYRLGLATTRRQARQLVNHGHVLVDGKRVDIPSYHVEVGQVISVREKSQNISTIKEAVEATAGRASFVSFDSEKLEGSLTRLPERDELSAEVDEALVVESLQPKTLRFSTDTIPFGNRVFVDSADLRIPLRRPLKIKNRQ